MSVSCPVCNVTLPLPQIESHVNAHFDDDEINPQIANDHYLALQLASFDPSSSASSSLNLPSTLKEAPFLDPLDKIVPFLQIDPQIAKDHYSPLQLASDPSSTLKEPPFLNPVNKTVPFPQKNDDDVASLVRSQTKSPFYRVGNGGLICLLKTCLESKTKPLESSTSLLSGFVDHFQSSKEDKGWGCGWRNIQMQCSHLLSLRNQEEVKRVLFGGSDFVPDIPSLQLWLELAWNSGFDTSGSAFR